jgi:hypothetical protein
LFAIVLTQRNAIMITSSSSEYDDDSSSAASSSVPSSSLPSVVHLDLNKQTQQQQQRNDGLYPPPLSLDSMDSLDSFDSSSSATGGAASAGEPSQEPLPTTTTMATTAAVAAAATTTTTTAAALHQSPQSPNKEDYDWWQEGVSSFGSSSQNEEKETETQRQRQMQMQMQHPYVAATAIDAPSSTLGRISEAADIQVWLSHSHDESDVDVDVDTDADADADMAAQHDGEDDPNIQTNNHASDGTIARDVESGSPKPTTPENHPGYHRSGQADFSLLTLCASFCILILILAVVGLSVALTRQNSMESASSATTPVPLPTTPSSPSPTTLAPTFSRKPTPAPSTSKPSRAPTLSTSPTVAPTELASLVPTQDPRVELVRSWIVEQNYSSAIRFDDPTSPQFLAMMFMAEDTLDIPTANANATDDEQTYQWLQRYVITLFYYALTGENWWQPLNFLNHSLPTCAWNTIFSFPGGVESPLGVICATTTNGTRAEELRVSKSNPM